MRRLLTPAAVLLVASPVLAQGTLDLELHAVMYDAANGVNQYDAGPITVDASGLTELSIHLFVRAHLVSDPEATGLTTFEGRLTRVGSGALSPSQLACPDWIGFPPCDPSHAPSGLTPDYRGVVGGEMDLANGMLLPNGDWRFVPMSLAPMGVPAAVLGLDDIYRVEWITTDLSPRTVHLTLSANGAGYMATDEFRQLRADQGAIDADTFTIIIDGPGCTCEYDGAPGVNVFDLLAYLDLWFLGDDHADIDGQPGLDVFDLLHFLDCWFPTTAGAPCP